MYCGFRHLVSIVSRNNLFSTLCYRSSSVELAQTGQPLLSIQISGPWMPRLATVDLLMYPTPNSWYVTCFCVQDWLLHLTSSISPALPLTRGLLAGNCWLLLVRFFLIDHFLPLHYKDINVSILYLTAEVEELCGRKDQTSGNYQGYSSASEQVMSVLIHISPPVCLAYFRSKYFVSLILILSDLIWLCMYSWIQLILVGAAWISQLESKKFK